MSALGMASLGTHCSDRALGMATLGVLCGAVPTPVVLSQTAGAHRNHLWRPVREAVAPPVAISSRVWVRSRRPEYHNPVVEGVWTPWASTKGKASVSTMGPKTSVQTKAVAQKLVPRVGIALPRTSASTPYTQADGAVVCRRVLPEAGAVTPEVGVAGKTYYAYWTPETVQNPTTEMLVLLS